MTKKNISFLACFMAILAGVAFAGFDKTETSEVADRRASAEGTFQLAKATFDETPTSELADRRASAESAVKTAALLEQILAENKRTNQLLEQLVKANGGAK